MVPQSVSIENGAIRELSNIILAQQAKRVLLVRGTKSYEGSAAQKILEPLRKDITFLDFFGFDHNPSAVDVKKALDLIGETNPDIVVAIGGGSAIDMAKLVRTALVLGYDETIRRAKEGVTVESDEKNCPLAVVPTTAGTGSEVTSFAVVYIHGVKFSLAGAGVLPDFSIVDPALTYGLPPKITADTGLDALCQAIESFWSVKSSKESRLYAISAIESVVGNLEIAVNNPTKESRLAMCEASHNAGKAINLTTTTAAHAVSYPLTMHFGIAHGHAVSLTLCEFLILNQPTHETFSSRLNSKLDLDEYTARLESLYQAFRVNNAKEMADRIYSMIDNIGLESDLSVLGVDESSYKTILSEVNPQRLGNNPTSISEDQIRLVLSQPFLNSRT